MGKQSSSVRNGDNRSAVLYYRDLSMQSRIDTGGSI